VTSSFTALAATHAAGHTTISLSFDDRAGRGGHRLRAVVTDAGPPAEGPGRLLPAVLTVLGILDLTGSSAPHLTPKDITFLVVSAALSVVLGGARGATLELYPRGGELWQRYRPVTSCCGSRSSW
jgi:hypothetical protein